MKIRSITYFCNPKYPLHEKILQRAGAFLAKAAYEAQRLATQKICIPFVSQWQAVWNR